MTVALLFLIFSLSIAFTWTNGFQHSSAVAACAFASHSIEKRQAMVIICVFEILGTIFGGSAVAGVIQSLSGWNEEPSLLPLLASALVSAIAWNFIARQVKMPASSTHALIGGMIGSLVAGAGNFSRVKIGTFDIVHPSGVIGAVFSLFLSPALGFLVGLTLFSLSLLLFLRASNTLEKRLRRYQWLSVSLLAFGDGQNDTQKTMGLLVLAMNAAGMNVGHDIPLWIRGLIGIAMGAGAFFMSTGVVKELAFAVYDIKPLHAVVAETSSAAVLIANSIVGGPVSASQVIAASLMGVGYAERLKGIHWMVIKDITLSWAVTIPATALLSAGFYLALFRWLTYA